MSLGVLVLAVLWSLLCFFAGAFVFSPSFRDFVLRWGRNMRSGKKDKVQLPEAWKQDIGVGQPRPRSEVSAAAPSLWSPDPRRPDKPPLRDEQTIAATAGPQRAPQPAPEPAAAGPAANGNGGMTVAKAKSILQARGYNVKRKRRKPKAVAEG